MFFMYREGRYLTGTGHHVPRKSYTRYFYPVFNLCSGELLGIRVPVPCQPVNVLRKGMLITELANYDPVCKLFHKQNMDLAGLSRRVSNLNMETKVRPSIGNQRDLS